MNFIRKNSTNKAVYEVCIKATLYTYLAMEVVLDKPDERFYFFVHTEKKDIEISRSAERRSQ